MRTTRRILLIAGALVLPVSLFAQSGRGPGGPGGPESRGGPGGPDGAQAARAMSAPGVTQILNARRVLDLTPRQVAQLDSIERSLVSEMRATQARGRALGDSIARQRRASGADARSADDSAGRRAMRERMEQTMRPQLERLRSRDSTARAGALRVLNDAQRQQLREIQAEERGRQRGLQEARGARRGGGRGAMRGRGAPNGMRGPMRGPIRGPIRGDVRDP